MPAFPEAGNMAQSVPGSARDYLCGHRGGIAGSSPTMIRTAASGRGAELRFAGLFDRSAQKFGDRRQLHPQSPDAHVRCLSDRLGARMHAQSSCKVVIYAIAFVQTVRLDG
jgi:hypothetical protein